jgi:hypothetical protein
MSEIQLKMQDGKIFAKTTKSECEVEFYPASTALCAKGHGSLPYARLFVPTNPIWWLEDDAQRGKWVNVEFTYAVAGK